MNERIQELIVEATVKVNNPLVDSHGEIVCDDWEETIDLEKFAELIVKECMTICDTEKADYAKHRKGAWDFEEKNIYAEGEAACDTLKFKIKRKFGVK